MVVSGAMFNGRTLSSLFNNTILSRAARNPNATCFGLSPKRVLTSVSSILISEGFIATRPNLVLTRNTFATATSNVFIDMVPFCTNATMYCSYLSPKS